MLAILKRILIFEGFLPTVYGSVQKPILIKIKYQKFRVWNLCNEARWYVVISDLFTTTVLSSLSRGRIRNDVFTYTYMMYGFCVYIRMLKFSCGKKNTFCIWKILSFHAVHSLVNQTIVHNIWFKLSYEFAFQINAKIFTWRKLYSGRLIMF